MENKFVLDFSFSQEDVIVFSEVTGDKNPIHLDEEYASKTLFKKRIVHGFLGASVFSKILGTLFPGEGTIYLKQDLKFMAPMFTDKTYKARVEVIEIFKEKKRARLRTTVADESQNLLIDGEALVQNTIFG